MAGSRVKVDCAVRVGYTELGFESEAVRDAGNAYHRSKGEKGICWQTGERKTSSCIFWIS